MCVYIYVHAYMHILSSERRAMAHFAIIQKLVISGALLLFESNKTEASHIILAVVLTRKSRWHSSNAVSSTRVCTRPCSTVARSRSSHRCSTSSRSDDGVPNATSIGPHRENSSTDFTCDSETARSLQSRLFMRGVRVASGRSSFVAANAHWQRDPSSLASRTPSACRIQSLGCRSRSSQHNTKFDSDKGASSMPCA